MSPTYKRWYDHDPLLLEVIELLRNYQTELRAQAEIFLQKIEEKVSKELDKKITLKNLIDKELIGGFKIVVGSIVIEDSVKSELKAMKDSLIFNSKEGGV